MEEINQKISSIINASDEGSLAIFIGAGLSKTADNEYVKLPSWSDLINELQTDLDIYNETDPLKIAQLYYIEFGEYLYQKKIKKFFPDNLKPSQAHKLILDLNVNTIITTNWDVLIENSIQENAYVYDVISSDQDLVRSSLPKKIIKMHGDFKNNNIVFKEDDYINYSYNFPLIENYVKSIISTHTVLFIGYSYNDIDLKQIVKWSQNHSDVRPPMYLVVFKENKTQRKYLENHGITTILLNQTPSSGDIDYSRLTTDFIERIKNSNSDYIASSNAETINFIYKKLIRFSQMNAILIDQIKLALTNCLFTYKSDNEAIIELCQNIETIDYNANTRKIYKNFIDILSNCDDNKIHENPKIRYIFQTFCKAGIIGIHIKKDEKNSAIEHYHEFKDAYKQKNDLIYDCCLNFKENGTTNSSNDIQSLLDNAYIHYLKNDYENTYTALDEVVSECLKQKSYTQLFISIFNKNIILNNLKYSASPRYKYNSIQRTDIKELYLNLPKDLRLTLEPIYNFVNFDFLYRHNYNVDEQLKNKENAMDSISSGGFILQFNIYESAFQHNNLLSFLIKNRIMIDNYKQIKELHEKFISISVIRQFQSNEVTLNQLELYSCVKIVRSNKLMGIINISPEKNDKLRPKLKPISISTENKNWLIRTVLFSLIDEYTSPDKNTHHKCEEIQNAMFLIASIKLLREELLFIFECIEKLIVSERSELSIYHAINTFLGIRHNLFEGEITSTEIINTLEKIIEKLAHGRYNGYDFIAFTRHKLSNLYGYAKITKSKFTNTKLVSELFSRFKNASEKNKISLCNFLLFSIYDIANKSVVTKISKFATAINTANVDKHEKVPFELLLVKLKIKEMSTEVKKETICYITKFDNGNGFSSDLDYIRYLLEDILMELEDKELNEALIVLNSIIQVHNENPMQSIF